MSTGPEDSGAVAVIPGDARFTVTPAALEMIGVFGGSLHCFQASGGCRSQGLYFSRTRPKMYLQCILDAAAHGGQAVTITVSHELAARLDGAVLDFGRHNRMQRFVWAALPAVKGPQCTCLRSVGKPAGKRSPCLDDAGVGITDL